MNEQLKNFQIFILENVIKWIPSDVLHTCNSTVTSRN